MAFKPNSKKSDAPALHIQAFIRVRPLGETERRTPNLLFGKREVTTKSSCDPKLSKTQLFDRVFEEDIKQVNVYNTVVRPMIKEVLQGYNCTVFAYGQTGTGKTYTMTGQAANGPDPWTDNMHAGVMPRAIDEIFTQLALQPCEYQVSVHYVELYNEKLRSLLASHGDDNNIQLNDDPEGGVMFRGAPPIPVKTKEEAFKLLQQGAEKRQTAATNLNLNSSRSHTIFTINVNIKENGFGDKEDVLRIGKLYLVDLAGSENVSRSGANEAVHKTAQGVNQRMAEAGKINQSLLTLGRVINAIIENSIHIPYRESKLTRILQDSLGGRTKTCIIGTISPAHANLDETESTLKYMYAARSIKNKPEKNTKISQREFMQLASEEIKKLKRDLEATRRGDGFYISMESHDEMITRMQELDTQVRDWNDRYNSLNVKFEEREEIISHLNSDLEDKCAECEELEKVFHSEMQKAKEKLDDLAKEITVREYLLKQYSLTECQLTEEAKVCKSVLENLHDQTVRLHNKIDRKSANENKNADKLAGMKTGIGGKLDILQGCLGQFFQDESSFLGNISSFTTCLGDRICDENKRFYNEIDSLDKAVQKYAQEMEMAANDLLKSLEDDLVNHSKLLQQGVADEKSRCNEIKNEIKKRICYEFKEKFLTIHDTISEEKKKMVEHKNEFVKSLVQETEERKTRLDETKTIIMKELNVAQSLAEEAEKNAVILKKTSACSKETAEKVKVMMQELVALTGKVAESADKNEVYAKQQNIHLNSCQEVIECASSKLEKESEVLHTRLTEHQSSILDSYDESLSQISSTIGSVLDEHNALSKNLDVICAKNLTALDKRINKESASIKHLQVKVGQSRSYPMEEVEGRKALSMFLKATQESLSIYKEEIYKKVYDQYCQTKSRLNVIADHVTETNRVISDINDFTGTVTYSADVPTGNTPQRVTQDQLVYPRTFRATTPRGILVERFLKSGEQQQVDFTNPQRQEISSSTLPEDSSSSSTGMSEAEQSCITPARRSISVPDLSKFETEEKENLALNKSLKSSATKGKLNSKKNKQILPIKRGILTASNVCLTSSSKSLKKI